MTTDYSRMLDIFDKQIKIEYRINYGDIQACESYWAKRLFVASKDLSVDDWRELRDEEYWEGHDCRKGILKKMFILDKVNQYNKKNN